MVRRALSSCAPNTIQCVKGGKGVTLHGEHIRELYACVFDQIPNLQNCFTAPNKTYEGRRPQTANHLAPRTFSGQFLRKADI
jgi:hypothetical protein